MTLLDKPILLNLGQATSGTNAVYSENGTLWSIVQHLPGTTLPSNLHQGYYIAKDGNLMILTDHLGYFGMKKLQSTLVLTASATRISSNQFTTVRVTGGRGGGALTYQTKTPTVCTVSTHGLVYGIKAGSCIVTAAKAGDDVYMNSVSGPVVITFVAVTPTLPAPPLTVQGMKITGTNRLKLIQVNLGKAFGGKSIVIKILVPGAKTYVTLCTVTLNKTGMVNTTRAVPSGSTVEVYVDGKSKAVTKVK